MFMMPIAAALGLFLFLSVLGSLLSPRGPEIAGNIRMLGPLSYLGIPGINPYLPYVYGWLALFAAIVIHEGAHGVIARSLGIPVKSSGLIFFLFVPIGAFVDVDESVLKSAPLSHKVRVLAAGVGINLILAILCLLLLFNAVSTMRPSSNQGFGAIVIANSPLSNAGVRTYDYIIGIDGVPTQNVSVVSGGPWYHTGTVVSVTFWRDGTLVQRSITIGNQSFLNETSGQVFTLPYLGVSSASPSVGALRNLVSTYNSFFREPALYLCMPTLPQCQGVVPFSERMSGFYDSSFGAWLVPVTNMLYWLFFINFNLAIFNAIPIYPFDGGQTFDVGLRGLLGERWASKLASKLTAATTLVAAAMIILTIVGPYLLY